jgi:hypothetical protein
VYSVLSVVNAFLNFRHGEHGGHRDAKERENVNTKLLPLLKKLPPLRLTLEVI